MNKLFDYLKNPAPLYDKPWQTVLLCSFVVAAILAIFEPFAFRLNNIWQFLMLLGFVLLAFLTCTLFFVLLPRILPFYFAPKRWTNGRMCVHVISFLLFTGIMIFIYEYIWLGRHSVDEYWTKDFFIILSIDLLASITIGLIPITISIYMIKNRRLKENLLEAIKVNTILSQRLVKRESYEQILFESNNKESFLVNPESILYIESAGNYISIVYREEEHIKKKLLRSTIKQAEEVLQPHTVFIRCHRAFIVNTNHILTVSGNAQGYKLNLRYTEEAIPVSRTYMALFKDSLQYYPAPKPVLEKNF